MPLTIESREGGLLDVSLVGHGLIRGGKVVLEIQNKKGETTQIFDLYPNGKVTIPGGTEKKKIILTLPD